jgi:AraC-like DNA-binding protein
MIAAVYLLLRRGNAFAPGVTPPLRLRRWAASFFAAMALGHVLWYFFYIYSCDIRSVSYVVVAVVDCVGMLITIAGTLLAMLQDRKRPVWPIVVALVPYVVIGALYIAFPNDIFLNIAIVYLLLLYAIFTIYMVFAVRRYGRWLNDNYADLENKKVWLSQTVSLVCLLLFILYALVGIDTIQIYILHFGELVAFGLLLWRVETLPQLENSSMEAVFFESTPEAAQEKNLPTRKRQPLSIPSNIEELLDELCVNTQLYLQHDLSLLQLAQVLGINRFYLSQYFSRQGTTYNAYINDLRIDHFIRLYREATAAHQSVTAQQLARDSGYRSYSTFGLAFKQRTGQSVTAWMRNTGE